MIYVCTYIAPSIAVAPISGHLCGQGVSVRVENVQYLITTRVPSFAQDQLAYVTCILSMWDKLYEGYSMYTLKCILLLIIA
jgi:hypothetical protein